MIHPVRQKPVWSAVEATTGAFFVSTSTKCFPLCGNSLSALGGLHVFEFDNFLLITIIVGSVYYLDVCNSFRAATVVLHYMNITYFLVFSSHH